MLIIALAYFSGRPTLSRTNYSGF